MSKSSKPSPTAQPTDAPAPAPAAAPPAAEDLTSRWFQSILKKPQLFIAYSVWLHLVDLFGDEAVPFHRACQAIPPAVLSAALPFLKSQGAVACDGVTIAVLRTPDLAQKDPK